MTIGVEEETPCPVVGVKDGCWCGEEEEPSGEEEWEKTGGEVEEKSEGGEVVMSAEEVGCGGRKLKEFGGTASVCRCDEEDEVRNDVLSLTGSGGIRAQIGCIDCLLYTTGGMRPG